MKTLSHFKFKKDQASLIINDVAHKLHISPDDIFSKSRIPEYVIARCIVSKALHSRGFKLVDIGKILNKDHSTIIYMLNKHDGIFKNINHKYFNTVLHFQEINIMQTILLKKIAVREKINFHKEQIKSLEKILKKLKY